LPVNLFALRAGYSGVAEGDASGEASGEAEASAEAFFFAGEGDASVLLLVLFFLAVVELEEEAAVPPSVFFLAVVEVAVVAPAFFVVVFFVVEASCVVAAVVLDEADSFLAQETKKVSVASIVKDKTSFFIYDVDSIRGPRLCSRRLQDKQLINQSVDLGPAGVPFGHLTCFSGGFSPRSEAA
jgi:hypothetical protein